MTELFNLDNNSPIANILKNPPCNRCSSRNVKRDGRSPTTGKQKFKCSDCNKRFVTDEIHQEDRRKTNISIRSIFPENITPKQMFDYDVWDVKVLGLKPTTDGSYSLTFTGIDPYWLKVAVKKWIWHESAKSKTSTIIDKTYSLRIFSKFLKSEGYFDLLPQSINRNLFVSYLIYLSRQGYNSATKNHAITHFKQFMEDCARWGWANVNKEQIVYKEDYPKQSEVIPRYIPEEVLKQVEDNLNALHSSVVCIYNILRDTGMRISEICNLPYDCVEQDVTGGYWIKKIYQPKMDKEIPPIPISRELASLVINQQQYIRENLGNNWNYLFCDTENSSSFSHYFSDCSRASLKPISYFKPVFRKLDPRTLRGYLHRFAEERNIRDASGKIFPLGKVHQLRHTHGTELINAGVPQHIIQQRLGHKSPDMTSRYAHIHDRTMKAEMEKFWDGKVVNNKGEVVVPENPDLDTAEMQWVKKNMKAQTLPDGFCGLPVTKTCPAQDDPCSNCSFFRTTRQYLETHKKRLEETEKLIENARKNGWERQVEKNLPIAENLRKIIRGLEQKDVIYGDEKFPKHGGEENA